MLRRRGNIWEQWVLEDVRSSGSDSVSAYLKTYMAEEFDAR